MIEIVRPILKKINESFNTTETYFDTGHLLNSNEHMDGGGSRKYDVYTDFKEEGVTLPAFFVKVLSSDLVPRLGRFYTLKNLISITYLSDTSDMLALESVRLKMLFALKDIRTFQSLGTEGRNLKAVIEDNAVIMTGNYNLEIEEVSGRDDIPYMRVLDIDGFSEGEIKEKKLTLDEINKKLNPHLYKEEKEKTYNTSEDLKVKKKKDESTGDKSDIDSSIIDLVEKNENDNNQNDLMRRYNKWNMKI